VEALDDPRSDTPYLLPPPGTVDSSSVATGTGKDAVVTLHAPQPPML